MTTKPKTTAVAVFNDVLSNPVKFEQAQRVGKMMALSPLFPEHLRKGGLEVAMANAVLVQDMANRLSRPPLEVAQNIYFVSGKPSWSTSYLIGLANESGKLKGTITWEVTGEGDDLKVNAMATLAGGQKVEYAVTMHMAKAENWTKNPKYKSLPELMLRYRSATALIRLYMPEITMGVPSQEEAAEPQVMVDITPRETSSAPADNGDLVSDTAAPQGGEPVKEKPKKAAAKKPAAEVEEAVEVDGEPETETPHDPETGEVTEGDNSEPDEQEEADPEELERHEKFKEMILSELEACEDSDMLDAVLAMYAEQIDQLGAFHGPLKAEVDDAAKKRGEALSS